MRYGIADFTVKESELYRCESLAFRPPFPADDVYVQLSPARARSGLKPMLESAAVWLEFVTRSGFTACVDTSGPISDTRVGPSLLAECVKRDSVSVEMSVGCNR